GATLINLSRISESPTSPAWTISSEPRNASNASSRNNPCVSEISPIRAGSLRMEMLGIGSAGDTAQGITEKTLQDLERRNFGSNRSAQGLGAGNRKCHV